MLPAVTPKSKRAARHLNHSLEARLQECTSVNAEDATEEEAPAEDDAAEDPPELASDLHQEQALHRSEPCMPEHRNIVERL